MRSAKLTPAAATRIKISPGPGAGTGASVTRPMSPGPFSDVCRRACMVVGMFTGRVSYFPIEREENSSTSDYAPSRYAGSNDKEFSRRYAGGCARQAALVRSGRGFAYGAGLVLGTGLRGNLH